MALLGQCLRDSIKTLLAAALSILSGASLPVTRSTRLLATARFPRLCAPTQVRQVLSLGEGGALVETTPAGHQRKLLPGCYLRNPASSVCTQPVHSYQAKTTVNCIAFMPEGGRFMMGGSSGRVFTMESLELKETIPPIMTEASVLALRWMHNGLYMVSGAPATPPPLDAAPRASRPPSGDASHARRCRNTAGKVPPSLAPPSQPTKRAT